MEETKGFADCIPGNIVREIQINGKEQVGQHVYRVAKRGIIDNTTFMGSYEEALFENRPFKKDLCDIGSYSTSCYLTLKYPLKFLRFLKAKYYKRYPHPAIIHGNTICGLSQLTRERKLENKEEDHVDWWIYKNSLGKLITSFSFVDESKYERSDLE